MSGVGVKSATEKTAPAPVPKTDDQLLRQLLRRVAALELGLSSSANLAALLADESGSAGLVPFENVSTYVPTWSGGGIPPSLGNGSISGRYAKNGRICDFSILLTMGSTTTYGNNFWSLSTPFQMLEAWQTIDFSLVYSDVSAGINYLGRGTANTAFVFAPLTFAATQTVVSATAPFTWATGDTLRASGSFITT